MRSTWLAPFAAVALVACGGEAPPTAEEPRTQPISEAGASLPVAPDPASTAGNVPIPEGAALVGEYRVAGIDGEPLDAPIGIAVSISPETIELAPCAGLAWRYSYVAGTLETGRIPQAPDGLICRIPREVAAAGDAIDVATGARRTAANGIELAGGGHSVLLFSQ